MHHKIPVIYTLDENNEATHTMFYCSVPCRDLNVGAGETIGETSDYIDGTQCEECGRDVELGQEFICYHCQESRHGECVGIPCRCDCEVEIIINEPTLINIRHEEAIRILRRVYIYLNCIRGMAFVGIEHPSEIQAIIGAYLDDEN